MSTGIGKDIEHNPSRWGMGMCQGSQLSLEEETWKNERERERGGGELLFRVKESR
jgi:hypothetical protein